MSYNNVSWTHLSLAIVIFISGTYDKLESIYDCIVVDSEVEKQNKMGQRYLKNPEEYLRKEYCRKLC